MSSLSSPDELVAFGEVLRCPHGLGVGPVEPRNGLFQRHRKVVLQWDDVVHVPLSLVRPGHSLGELRFDVSAKGFNGASDIFEGPLTLCGAQGLGDSGAYKIVEVTVRVALWTTRLSLTV